MGKEVVLPVYMPTNALLKQDAMGGGGGGEVVSPVYMPTNALQKRDAK